MVYEVEAKRIRFEFGLKKVAGQLPFVSIWATSTSEPIAVKRERARKRKFKKDKGTNQGRKLSKYNSLVNIQKKRGD